jgi:hypothetical protein
MSDSAMPWLVHTEPVCFQIKRSHVQAATAHKPASATQWLVKWLGKLRYCVIALDGFLPVIC